MRILHDGVRRAWGLDAELLDLDGMSDAQLEAVAKGHMPR